jgi:PKD repeat protein
MRINLVRICIAFILAGMVLFGSVQAEEPVQVTVTAAPATVSAGSSAQIQVTVTYYGQAMDGATIVANTNTGSATLTPSSRSTDSSGKAIFRLDTTSSTSGTVRVSATVTKQTIDAYYTGNGYVDVPVQSVVMVPLEPVVLVSTTTPVPQPYQPPAAPPYQPPAAPPYQPYQPPAPQQPLPAGAQAPVAVISVDNYAGNIPLTVTFDGQQSYAPDGSISSYAWDFGDGSTGTGYIAQHTYSAPGTFTASLIVTDNNGLSSNPATTQIQGGIQVQQQQPVYRPPQQQQVYQPPPEQPVKKSEAAPLPKSAIEPGQPCDDGNKCTIDDYYDCNHKCNAGRNLTCDKGLESSSGTCNPSIGCVYTQMPQVLDMVLSNNKCSGYTNFFSVSDASGKSGSEIQVPVMACNVTNLLLMTLNVDYNYAKPIGGDSNAYRKVLQFKRAEKGSLTSDAGFDASQVHIADGKNTNDRILITLSSPSSYGYSGSGSVAVLVFDVIQTGRDQNMTLITPAVSSATDISNHPLTVTTLGGTFIVKTPPQGSWDGSGKVTSKDALAAQQMVAGKLLVDLRLDMNNDAKVNSADVSTIQQIAAGERKPMVEPENAQRQISNQNIINKIKSEYERYTIAGKIDRVNHAYDVDLNSLLASLQKPAQNNGPTISLKPGLPRITGSSLLAQQSQSLPPLKITTNSATACLPPRITSVKSDTKISAKIYVPAGAENIIENSTATINGINLGTCNLTDCGIYLEYPVGEVEFTQYYYEKMNGKFIDNSSLTPIDPNKFGRLPLLPSTGSWGDRTVFNSQGTCTKWIYGGSPLNPGPAKCGEWSNEASWSNDRINVEIPSIRRESAIWVPHPRYATLVVPIWSNGNTPTQTVLRYPVWLNIDMPGISTIYSNPDYSKELKANPSLYLGGHTVIPMFPYPESYYETPIAVSGGDLLITGTNFGNQTGEVKIVFTEPLITYAQNSNNPDLWEPNETIKEIEIPVTNSNWSDNAVKLTVPKIPGSYDVTGGYLYMKNHDTPPGLWSWTPILFSPKWKWKQISGIKFFRPDPDNENGLEYSNVSGVLVVSHQPVDCKPGGRWDYCSRLVGVKSGDWGFDTLFKEKPLPPNVKLLYMKFNKVEAGDDWQKNFEFGYEFLSEFYDDPMEAFVEMFIADLELWLGSGTGEYGVQLSGPTPVWSETAPISPDNPYLVEEHLVKATDPAITIEWHTTCYPENPSFCGKPVGYTFSIFVRAPEDVDVGD